MAGNDMTGDGSMIDTDTVNVADTDQAGFPAAERLQPYEVLLDTHKQARIELDEAVASHQVVVTGYDGHVRLGRVQARRLIIKSSSNTIDITSLQVEHLCVEGSGNIVRIAMSQARDVDVRKTLNQVEFGTSRADHVTVRGYSQNVTIRGQLEPFQLNWPKGSDRGNFLTITGTTPTPVMCTVVGDTRLEGVDYHNITMYEHGSSQDWVAWEPGVMVESYVPPALPDTVTAPSEDMSFGQYANATIRAGKQQNRAEKRARRTARAAARGEGVVWAGAGWEVARRRHIKKVRNDDNSLSFEGTIPWILHLVVVRILFVMVTLCFCRLDHVVGFDPLLVVVCTLLTGEEFFHWFTIRRASTVASIEVLQSGLSPMRQLEHIATSQPDVAAAVAAIHTDQTPTREPRILLVCDILALQRLAEREPVAGTRAGDEIGMFTRNLLQQLPSTVETVRHAHDQVQQMIAHTQHLVDEHEARQREDAARVERDAAEARERDRRVEVECETTTLDTLAGPVWDALNQQQ